MPYACDGGMSSFLRMTSSLCGAILLCACGDYEPVRSDVISVGTGLSAFEALDDGDSIDVVEGPQGGTHVWVGLQCDSCPGDSVRVTVGARDSGGDWINDQPSQAMAELIEDGDGKTAAGMRAYLDESSGSDYLDEELILSASVTIDGEEHTDEVRVIVTDVSFDEPF